MYICQYCKKQHDGTFGRGRFCSANCCAKYSAKKYNISTIRTSDGKWQCGKCNQIFITRKLLLEHKKTTHQKQTYQNKIKNIDLEQLKTYYFETLSKHKTRKKYCLNRKQWKRYVQQNNIHQYSLSQIVSINIKRHPDKYYWHNKQNRKISQPCEYFKTILDQNEIKYYPQYQDYNQFKHFYSIDIAFPKSKLAIQINGTQHYDKHGMLSQYYQKRHDVIKSCGWTILQIPYYKVYDKQTQESIIKTIKDNIDFKYDYSQQIKQFLNDNQKQYICQNCGGQKKTKKSHFCKSCSKKHIEKLNENRSKIIIKSENQYNKEYICSYCGKQFVADWNRKSQNQYCSQDCYQKSQHRFELTIKQLENLIKQYSLSQIGRMYGVTCNAIKKRCLKYNIDYKQYKQQIKSKNMKKVMQQKYKDYINPKQVCPICGKWKKYNSKTCRDCYINN